MFFDFSLVRDTWDFHGWRQIKKNYKYSNNIYYLPEIYLRLE